MPMDIRRAPVQLVLPVRRDCPEIILPDNAGSGDPTVGSSDVLGAWTEICSQAEFGNEPLVWAGLSTTFAVGASIGPPFAAAVMYKRQGRFELGIGGTGVEATFAEGFFGGAAIVQIIGHVDDAITATVIGVFSVLYKQSPILLPARTRVSVRAAVNDAVADPVLICYGIAYDPRMMAHQHYIGSKGHQYVRGLLGGNNEITAYSSLTVGLSVAWDNGAYATLNVNGLAQLDADYLVSGGFIHGINEVFISQNAIADVAVSPSGSSGDEVIQSRIALPQGRIYHMAHSQHEFPGGPFIAYKGESLRVRIRDGSTTQARTYNIFLQLEKVGAA